MNFEKLFTSVFLIHFVFALHAQDLYFNSNLPIVFINTNGGNIVDDPRITAQMGIAWNEDGETSSSDPSNHFNGNIKIEIRGSSSQMFEKKSFAFELKDELDQDTDFPLLGMPEEEDWILYAPYTDKSLIRNVLTFTLASQISDVYVPRCKFVELFLNKKYEGVYVLMENIKRDSMRVDIAKLKTDDIEGEQLTGGYIVKIDKTTGGSGDGWHSDFNNSAGSKTYYQYEYPSAGDIQVQQKEYIKDYIYEFERTVYNEEFHPETGYSSLINTESFFDFIIMNEISKNVDGYRLSTF
ncbi:MAG: CotH kinase family protein, partial [Bacteroidetes bacterium]|nr:CotH kinase family protein [Bacteroidota bacterium]